MKHYMNFTWLFDLDNTLHDADAGIFESINRQMTRFISNKLNVPLTEASLIRAEYWVTYGATLEGLVRHHNIDASEFLTACHSLPEITPLISAEPKLRINLNRLLGSKAVFSNGPAFYVAHILDNLQITDCFEAIFGTDSLGMKLKPQPSAFHLVCEKLNTLPERCIFVDDSLANLKTAKELDMTTIWFRPNTETPDWVDCSVDNFSELLSFAEKRGLILPA